LQADGRKDALLEQVVARLSLEESISSVRWEVSSHSDENGTTFSALAPGRTRQKQRQRPERALRVGRRAEPCGDVS